jgi:hypothetical protein
MIGSAAHCRTPFDQKNLQAAFLAIVPRIERHASMYFRDVKCPNKKADRVAEAVALAWKWYRRLAERGKDASTFPAVFAALVSRAVRSGRRICGQERAKDVMSPVAQQRHGFRVEHLPSSTRTDYEAMYAKPRGQQIQDAFEQRLQDNTVTPVPDQAAFRIDFPRWLSSLTARERRIVRAMIGNEHTKDLSRQFAVSPGRISQLRRQFEQGWSRFSGESEQATALAG